MVLLLSVVVCSALLSHSDSTRIWWRTLDERCDLIGRPIIAKTADITDALYQNSIHIWKSRRVRNNHLPLSVIPTAHVRRLMSVSLIAPLRTEMKTNCFPRKDIASPKSRATLLICARITTAVYTSVGVRFYVQVRVYSCSATNCYIMFALRRTPRPLHYLDVCSTVTLPVAIFLYFNVETVIGRNNISNIIVCLYINTLR